VLTYLPQSIRTFALTQRGHGDASRAITGYHPVDFENDLVGFKDALELDMAIIAGGSSGGIIARCFTIDHPNRAPGLILAGSPLTLQDKPFIFNADYSTVFGGIPGKTLPCH